MNRSTFFLGAIAVACLFSVIIIDAENRAQQREAQYKEHCVNAPQYGREAYYHKSCDGYGRKPTP